MHNRLKKKLIKYLEENFNAIKVDGVFEVYHSDLHVSDLYKVAKAFKGFLMIDDDGDVLVDRHDNLCLHIMYDRTAPKHTFSDKTLAVIHTTVEEI